MTLTDVFGLRMVCALLIHLFTTHSWDMCDPHMVGCPALNPALPMART